MRTFSIIAIAATLATPVAALQITKVMSQPVMAAELSVDERKPGIQHAERNIQDRKPGSWRAGSQTAELGVDDRKPGSWRAGSKSA